ncbi:alpha/beta fold hydrolase [Acidovorax sp. JHL-3]|uniref:alpha/beta fold hydrolase n=1 Tax=Acidovorax sp. JHL-3 TaxID=1276755 RepID=UPI00046408A3|nr:alpha/beta hydrolase [Acidovorax sp. JHL-3]
MYVTRQTSRREFVAIRQLSYHVRLWGPETSTLPPLVLVHGWMDVAASYQFVVEAFGEDFLRGRRIIAPDWRGFGLTAPPVPTDHYFFPEYLADLDQLLDHYAPGTPVDLVGHSMGGNVVMFYAGARPERIRRLVNLEGFGMPATQPSQAPARYAQWMDEMKQLQQGAMALKSYDSAAGVAQRLMKTNPRLSQDKADWLAQHWAAPNASGQWNILGDPAHKITSAQLFRLDEVLALYEAISAPTLAVEAGDDSLGQWWKGKYNLDEYHQRLTHVRNCRIAVVPDAGHMLHHDQPEAVAALIEQFVGDF